MRIEDFDLELPQELIAQEPVHPRDHCRLMVVYPDGKIEHRYFYNLIEYLSPGDVLVLNNTRVRPYRLRGVKTTGANIEILLTRRLSDRVWEALANPSRRLHLGTEVLFDKGLKCKTIQVREGGWRILEFNEEVESYLDELGEVPLPPYIHRKVKEEDYQTIFARVNGSVAAPTAGIHFTDELLERIEAKGVEILYVTLHVGPGTFLPVRVEEIEKHYVLPEEIEVTEETAERINRARSRGGKIVAVGTTVVRTLESVAEEDGRVKSYKGKTDLYIYPGYKFKVIDRLVTNFHLPKSSLIILVSAFRDREIIMNAYREAIRLGYRFYSLGDAMLLY
ncbi:MAG TPA: tRNA preQ1(34) S-adenosylmethionine ribosyltransferase-isomerase QueA [bacterium]|nr:tRNA preQ1(34) S-adenosylmethionine ribosyltransferase-isomerase QueA [Dictyoglomota bacterium]HPO82010.1 tRNA preQ1(34) S-adenosylmethionine ribosyltransferase-isomerase QueA [bacterium]HRR90807.1 tRNA preQ1(34) S-adenosylmethionine ribosyltransferase-isomerase QueA [bacterium]